MKNILSMAESEKCFENLDKIIVLDDKNISYLVRKNCQKFWILNLNKR